MGTLAGAWMPLIFTVLLALSTLPKGLNGDGNLWASLWLAVSPVTVTLPIVLGSCVLVGLPTAWCLKFFGAERKGNYLFAGAMWGFAIPLLILLYMGAQEGWWLALLGSFSGGVTAATWWRSIQQS